MRHFLFISIITLALITSTVGIAHAVHAASSTVTVAPTKSVSASASVLLGSDSPINLNPGQTTASGFNSIMTWIVSLFAWLVGVAALTLDYAVYYTVINMGAYVKHLSAVGTAWRIMRDLGNIFLIFGFLAAGIATILDLDFYGWGKKMLPALLISAIFLNFSLFLSEAVIDVGNLLATQFYTQINGGSLPTPASLANTSPSNEGISTAIMSQLGFSTLYPTSNPSVYTGDHSWLIGFLSIILFMTTAFVMFSLAFILIARFVALIFLIILSPVGFAGFAVPALAGKSKQWRDELFKQTITAPVLLLLLYVALAVITDAHFITGFNVASGGWLGFVNNTNLTGFAGILLSFLVAMGLLLYVTIKAKDLGAIGAAGATKLASKLSGATLAAGGIGWTGRHTIGLGGNYAAKKLGNTAFGRTFVGRGIADTLEKRVAKASFDVRNTKLAKMARGSGLDLGKGQKGGYTADLKSRAESYERAANRIKGRARTAEEEESLKKASEKTAVVALAHGTAKDEHETAKQEQAKLKEEVERLEKEKARNDAFHVNDAPAQETERQLGTARKNLATSEQNLASTSTKLAQATTNFEAAQAEEAKIKATVDFVTSEKGSKQEYADRLKDKWGKIPILGTAASIAGPRISANIGKSKDQKMVDEFLASVKEKVAKEDKTEEDQG